MANIKQSTKKTKQNSSSHNSKIEKKVIEIEEANKENIFTWFGIIAAAFLVLAFVMFVKK